MKYIIITITALLNSFFLIAQTNPASTYFLTTGEVTVFAFEAEPTFINVSTAEIMLQKEGNKVMLLPQGRFTKATLVAEVESRFYQIKLDWTTEKTKISYFQDFRENTINDCIAPEDTADKRYVEGNKYLVTKEVLQRVSQKLDAFREHKIIGTKLINSKDINDGFLASLVVAFVDQDHFYFKFKLQNKQSIIYDLNPIRLSFTSRQKNNLFKQDAVYKVEVKPTVLSSDIKSVAANSIEWYYIAVPLFALDAKGKLMITFTERNGMRDVTVLIYSNRISNLKVVTDYDLLNDENDSQTKN